MHRGALLSARPAPPARPAPIAAARTDDDDTRTLLGLVESYRLRDDQFDPDLFGDVAWAILLDLAIADRAGHQFRWSAACISRGIAQQTGSRMLYRLVERGLVIREPSLTDRRVFHARLSPAGRWAMIGWLRAVERMPPPAGPHQRARDALLDKAARHLRLAADCIAGAAR